MLFINPMWDSESERIGKQKCTPLGYKLHGISDLIGFASLLLLLVTGVYLRYRSVVGTYHSTLLWLHDGSKAVIQDYKGHPYKAKLLGVFCDKCDETILAYNASEEASWLAFRYQVDRQAASELVEIRKRLKLTQAQAAKLGGGGKNAFSRYERGQTKPVAAVINLFKLLDKHPDLIKELV